MSASDSPRRRERDDASDGALRVAVAPIDTPASFKNKAYAALKDVIVSMDVYHSRVDIRLDERRPSTATLAGDTPQRGSPRFYDCGV